VSSQPGLFQLLDQSPTKRKAPAAPIARRKDPRSSHAAAAAITRSGERNRQIAETLRLVVEHPGSTSLELTQFTVLDRYQLARRLPELERAKAVRKGVIRACSVGKRGAVTWYAV
jgi:hypothetical protein